MAHFEDHAPCNYHSGAHSVADWNCPLEAVGWLEYPNSFLIGPSPLGLSARIRKLAADFGSAFPAINFRGLHDCSLCREKGRDPHLEGSHINLFVPTDRAVLLTPGRVDHYIDVHSYLPPGDFVEYVDKCPRPGSNEYREAIRKVNGGFESPLFVSWPWVSPNTPVKGTRGS
jgi:hypothetical protein